MAKTQNKKIKKCFSILEQTINRLEKIAERNFSSMSHELDLLVFNAYERLYSSDSKDKE
ncbi:hypothetical protein [Methanobrevibacter sp.]|uniref:hypothetical protein n=1 Tax=Methanobrevibacter sp. TaxID=66852 RepID=UPI003868A7C8